MNRSASPSTSILVVDDDEHGLAFLRSCLNWAGFSVVAATSAGGAKEIIERSGTARFEVLLTDYRMPGGSGLDLLSWIRLRDKALSTIIITGEGEKDLVKESLQAGAVDFLEKPVAHGELVDAVKKAVAETRRQRRFAENADDLAAAGRLDCLLNAQVPAEAGEHIELFYRPLHEVGGDFVIGHRISEQRFVILVGDVSGHNLTAGFVSAYFQGLARAGLEFGRPLRESLNAFNQILFAEWNPAAAKRREMMTSLSLVAVEFDLRALTASTVLAGFPNPFRIDKNGVGAALGRSGFPLGWMRENPSEHLAENLSPEDSVLIFSDGLTDWANELEIDPMGLAFRLLILKDNPPDSIAPPPDDLILVRFQIQPGTVLTDQFHPIIHENYTGQEAADIDGIEAVWRRTLLYSLEKELGERVFDLLICLREAVLNAMIHGCERSPSKVCALHVSYRPSDRRLRVRVDDPGRGHGFDIGERLAQLSVESGRQLGLGLIQHLSDESLIENHGTSVQFDFLIDSSKHPDA